MIDLIFVCGISRMVFTCKIESVIVLSVVPYLKVSEIQMHLGLGLSYIRLKNVSMN